jgi:acetyl-CoA acetyltransferase
MASKPVALPLKLLDCCPVSDGGAAFVVSRERTGQIGVRVLGCAQAHTHQHVTAAPALSELGAEISIARAKAACGVDISDVRYAAVYDSFTITLAMLLEDLGLAGRGEAAARVRSGHFSRDGAMPLNTHGGLLSYGHCGVGGAMAHLVETHLQMTGRASNRQVRDASIALLHGDGGVLSSHVSMFLERMR